MGATSAKKSLYASDLMKLWWSDTSSQSNIGCQCQAEEAMGLSIGVRGLRTYRPDEEGWIFELTSIVLSLEAFLSCDDIQTLPQLLCRRRGSIFKGCVRLKTKHGRFGSCRHDGE